VEPGQLAMLHHFALGDFAPDLTVILDLPVEVGLSRAAARSAGDRFERLDRDFHERLRQGFRQIALDNPSRCVLIDASGDSAAVHRAFVRVVNERLGVEVPPYVGSLPASGAGQGRGSRRREGEG
jgi:dTMP kinase